MEEIILLKKFWHNLLKTLAGLETQPPYDEFWQTCSFLFWTKQLVRNIQIR